MPLRSQGYYGAGRGLLGLHWVCRNGRGPHLEFLGRKPVVRGSHGPLLPPHARRPARGNSRIPPQLEKNHVVPTSSQDGALARYGVSREVSRSVLSCETHHPAGTSQPEGQCLRRALPPIPPSIRVFSNESTLRMRWPKYWSFSRGFGGRREAERYTGVAGGEIWV